MGDLRAHISLQSKIAELEQEVVTLKSKIRANSHAKSVMQTRLKKEVRTLETKLQTNAKARSVLRARLEIAEGKSRPLSRTEKARKLIEQIKLGEVGMTMIEVSKKLHLSLNHVYHLSSEYNRKN